MSRANGPVDDIRNDASVNVVYADPGQDSYVSVSGNARVVDDLARKEQLWSKMNDAWFPRGPTDPDVALVEVQIIQAHYWDIDDSKIVQLFKMAAAAVTGNPPKTWVNTQPYACTDRQGRQRTRAIGTYRSLAAVTITGCQSISNGQCSCRYWRKFLTIAITLSSCACSSVPRSR